MDVVLRNEDVPEWLKYNVNKIYNNNYKILIEKYRKWRTFYQCSPEYRDNLIKPFAYNKDVTKELVVQLYLLKVMNAITWRDLILFVKDMRLNLYGYIIKTLLKKSSKFCMSKSLNQYFDDSFELFSPEALAHFRKRQRESSESEKDRIDDDEGPRAKTRKLETQESSFQESYGQVSVKNQHGTNSYNPGREIDKTQPNRLNKESKTRKKRRNSEISASKNASSSKIKSLSRKKIVSKTMEDIRSHFSIVKTVAAIHKNPKEKKSEPDYFEEIGGIKKKKHATNNSRNTDHKVQKNISEKCEIGKSNTLKDSITISPLTNISFKIQKNLPGNQDEITHLGSMLLEEAQIKVDNISKSEKVNASSSDGYELKTRNLTMALQHQSLSKQVSKTRKRSVIEKKPKAQCQQSRKDSTASKTFLEESPSRKPPTMKCPVSKIVSQNEPAAKTSIEKSSYPKISIENSALHESSSENLSSPNLSSKRSPCRKMSSEKSSPNKLSSEKSSSRRSSENTSSQRSSEISPTPIPLPHNLSFPNKSIHGTSIVSCSTKVSPSRISSAKKMSSKMSSAKKMLSNSSTDKKSSSSAMVSLTPSITSRNLDPNSQVRVSSSNLKTPLKSDKNIRRSHNILSFRNYLIPIKHRNPIISIKRLSARVVKKWTRKPESSKFSSLKFLEFISPKKFGKRSNNSSGESFDVHSEISEDEQEEQKVQNSSDISAKPTSNPPSSSRCGTRFGGSRKSNHTHSKFSRNSVSNTKTDIDENTKILKYNGIIGKSKTHSTHHLKMKDCSLRVNRLRNTTLTCDRQSLSSDFKFGEENSGNLFHKELLASREQSKNQERFLKTHSQKICSFQHLESFGIKEAMLENTNKLVRHLFLYPKRIVLTNAMGLELNHYRRIHGKTWNVFSSWVSILSYSTANHYTESQLRKRLQKFSRKHGDLQKENHDFLQGDFLKTLDSIMINNYAEPESRKRKKLNLETVMGVIGEGSDKDNDIVSPCIPMLNESPLTPKNVKSNPGIKFGSKHFGDLPRTPPSDRLEDEPLERNSLLFPGDVSKILTDVKRSDFIDKHDNSISSDPISKKEQIETEVTKVDLESKKLVYQSDDIIQEKYVCTRCSCTEIVIKNSKISDKSDDFQADESGVFLAEKSDGNQADELNCTLAEKSNDILANESEVITAENSDFMMPDGSDGFVTVNSDGIKADDPDGIVADKSDDILANKYSGVITNESDKFSATVSDGFQAEKSADKSNGIVFLSDVSKIGLVNNSLNTFDEVSADIHSDNCRSCPSRVLALSGDITDCAYKCNSCPMSVLADEGRVIADGGNIAYGQNVADGGDIADCVQTDDSDRFFGDDPEDDDPANYLLPTTKISSNVYSDYAVVDNASLCANVKDHALKCSDSRRKTVTDESKDIAEKTITDDATKKIVTDNNAIVDSNSMSVSTLLDDITVSANNDVNDEDVVCILDGRRTIDETANGYETSSNTCASKPEITTTIDENIACVVDEIDNTEAKLESGSWKDRNTDYEMEGEGTPSVSKSPKLRPFDDSKNDLDICVNVMKTNTQDKSKILDQEVEENMDKTEFNESTLNSKSLEVIPGENSDEESGKDLKIEKESKDPKAAEKCRTEVSTQLEQFLFSADNHHDLLSADVDFVTVEKDLFDAKDFVGRTKDALFKPEAQTCKNDSGIRGKEMSELDHNQNVLKHAKNPTFKDVTLNRNSMSETPDAGEKMFVEPGSSETSKTCVCKCAAGVNPHTVVSSAGSRTGPSKSKQTFYFPLPREAWGEIHGMKRFYYPRARGPGRKMTCIRGLGGKLLSARGLNLMNRSLRSTVVSMGKRVHTTTNHPILSQESLQASFKEHLSKMLPSTNVTGIGTSGKLLLNAIDSESKGSPLTFVIDKKVNEKISNSPISSTLKNGEEIFCTEVNKEPDSQVSPLSFVVSKRLAGKTTNYPKDLNPHSEEKMISITLVGKMSKITNNFSDAGKYMEQEHAKRILENTESKAPDQTIVKKATECEASDINIDSSPKSSSEEMPMKVVGKISEVSNNTCEKGKAWAQPFVKKIFDSTSNSSDKSKASDQSTERETTCEVVDNSQSSMMNTSNNFIRLSNSVCKPSQSLPKSSNILSGSAQTCNTKVIRNDSSEIQNRSVELSNAVTPGKVPNFPSMSQQARAKENTQKSKMAVSPSSTRGFGTHDQSDLQRSRSLDRNKVFCTNHRGDLKRASPHFQGNNKRGRSVPSHIEYEATVIPRKLSNKTLSCEFQKFRKFKLSPVSTQRVVRHHNDTSSDQRPYPSTNRNNGTKIEQSDAGCTERKEPIAFTSQTKDSSLCCVEEKEQVPKNSQITSGRHEFSTTSKKQSANVRTSGIQNDEFSKPNKEQHLNVKVCSDSTSRLKKQDSDDPISEIFHFMEAKLKNLIDKSCDKLGIGQSPTDDGDVKLIKQSIQSTLKDLADYKKRLLEKDFKASPWKKQKI